ncbi:uncharacterized protein LOC132716184 [Ruditapes philippinarum]|uniref:uncharacterized protein LOC132716184 n=1 Tax=Ruditapes philippinarum TaxID=129788 RepID=UPI00295A6BF2|nr:uncharacterized protein LOC132716184 [Ruditapes philippinarum]
MIPSGSIDEESTTSTNEEMSDINCVECMPVTEPKSKIDEVRPKVGFTPNLISPSTESALGADFATYARCEPANKYKQTNADSINSTFPEYYQNQNQDFFNIKGYVRSIQTTNETEIGQRSCVLQRNGTPFYQYTQRQVFSVPPRVINVVECPLEFESINLSIYNDFESNSNNINSTPNFPITSIENPEQAANYKIENKESIVEMNQTKCNKTTIEALNSKLRCTKTCPDDSLPGGPGNLPCFPKLFD